MPVINRQTPNGNRNAVKPTSDSVVDRIGQFDEDRGLKILVYGRSKTGKSRFVSTFPGKKLWIICSGFIASGEMKSLSDEAKKLIAPVRLHHSEEIKDLIQHVRKDSSRYPGGCVVDHVSGVQDKILAEVLKVEELPAQMTWGTASRDQFMEAGTKCREYFRSILALPGNTVLIGQERAPKDAAEESELLLPSIGVELMPSLAGWLYPAVDCIVQTCKMPKKEYKEQKVGGKVVGKIELTVPGADYCLRVGEDAIYTSGVRVKEGGFIPQFIISPTYAKLKKVIDGKWQEGDS